MKNLAIILTMVMGLQLTAQEFELKPTGEISTLKVEIEQLYGDLEIFGTNEGQIRIESPDYKGLPEKAKGLKPLSAVGPENTGVGLFVNQEGSVITIAGAHRKTSDYLYRIYLPKNVTLSIEYDSFQAEDIRVEGMNGEVEIDSKVGDVVIEDVTGPIVVNTLSSDIEVTFSSLNQESPTSLHSTSGDIDVTLPANTKGDFELKSVSGEVYTDLDFEFGEEDGLKRWGGGMSANAKLNGGGVEVSMKGISGDIFIRKSK